MDTKTEVNRKNESKLTRKAHKDKNKVKAK